LTGYLTDPSMDKGHGERRVLKGEAFNTLVELRRETTMLASVGTPFAAETD
jgi:hypothetical protein